jgi:HAD superfamily hydrolase (TIGR01484 family)
MPTHFETELGELPNTYEVALSADIGGLKSAIAGASESSIIAVGSGGSFTVASLLCHLHETYTARVSRPTTPLEIICNPTLAAASPVFLVSAEGKNPDIVEALERTRLYSARSVNVLTNRAESPLLTRAAQLSDVATHVFPLATKDGYLATNSLLLDSVLISRAYAELNRVGSQAPRALSDLLLDGLSIETWLEQTASFLTEASRRTCLLVVFSPLLRPIAADLESKLSEAALLHCQLADMRSFAHGRHLWLGERKGECAILGLVDPSLKKLWEATQDLLPRDIPVATMPFGGAQPQDLLAGLVAQMHLVSAIANRTSTDPGRPTVPSFGRDLHYIDLPSLIPAPRGISDGVDNSKYAVLGARWPTLERRAGMARALTGFMSDIERQTFRAIVFDYDGTLASSSQRDRPPSQSIIQLLTALLDGGVRIGVASGRGYSIHEHLRSVLPETHWPNVLLGLYNAGDILSLATLPTQASETSEYLSHVTRIMRRLQAIGVPIDTIRATHPFQVSVRFVDGVNTESTWFVVADALRQAGLNPCGVVRSKHSLDILEANVNKSHLIARLIQQYRVDPYEVLTIGDQGAWPGNDASLLEHRFSLSVDQPSRRLDRGWKLAPAHKRNVDATVWYLERVILAANGRFSVRLGPPRAA